MKRLLVASLVLAFVFGTFGFAQPAKAAGTYTIVYDFVTYDNGMKGGGKPPFWAKDSFHSIVTIEPQGDGIYKITFVDGGTFVTMTAMSPGGDGSTFVGEGVKGTISGGTYYLAKGTLKSNLPSHLSDDFRNVTGWGKYLRVFFDGAYTVLDEPQWGWTYSTCGNGRWTDNEATESLYGQVGPNPTMGDIMGAPAPCQYAQPQTAEYQPQSCNANSTVLAPFVGHRVRVYLIQPSGRQELQYEKVNYVERGLLPDGKTPTGKVSVVFYPKADSWMEFEGKTLLIRVEGYADGWYWYPKQAQGQQRGALFCDWAPAPGLGMK